jgi:5-methylcytosine-specific restriction endonuclease McrA
MLKRKLKRHCQLPKVSTVSGRSSSITNAFFNAIIPVHARTLEDELEALAVLEMRPDEICCVYCGDAHTEWDHLRPIIREKKPTGFITEIADLVPACGKCNQSKGGYNWREWMLGPAPRSPKSRDVVDIDRRVVLLERYESWRNPVRVDFDRVIEPQLWKRHQDNWREVLALLGTSQALAKQIRILIENATKRNA